MPLRLLAACLALAALSLLAPSQPTYDPWAWIIWGREITEADLTTTTGPSWKPLPVLFTTPFALAGDAAPALWLVVARAGGLLAIAFAYRVAARLAGPVAGVIAAGGIALSQEFIRHFARGNSEGLLVALCLWALERHLDGRRDHAFVLAVAAGLLRPEVWPFLALYGAYLLWRHPGRHLRLVTGAGVVTLAAWFVPEYLGSGDLLRAASRAREANLDSPAYAERPFLEVFERSREVLVPALLAGAAAALAWSRTRTRTTLAIGAAAAVLMIAVGLMTEAGFAGNLRYVALPAALVCVLAGVFYATLVAALRERGGRAAGALALAALTAGAVVTARAPVGDLRDDWSAVRSEADFVDELGRAVEIAGGPARARACEGIYTGRFQVPWVAWALHVHLDEVEIFAVPPGVVFAPRFSALERDPRFERVGETTKWIVGRACA